MAVRLVQVHRRTGGRPSPVNDPDGGWTWVRFVTDMEPGEYVIKVVEAENVQVPDDDAVPEPAITAACAAAISAATDHAGRIATGYDKLVAAQGGVIDRLAALAGKQPDEDPLTGMLKSAAAGFLPHLMQAAKDNADKRDKGDGK